MADLPYRAEYAKSARSACKTCREKIGKEELRLAVMVQSAMFDGKMPCWHHFSCFFNKQRPKTVGDISHFESLRWEDQEKIRKKVESIAGGSSATPSESSKKSTKRKKGGENLSDFSIQNATSSRATCRGCETLIIKTDIRASKKDYDSDEGRRFNGIDRWYHLECFAKCRAELEFWAVGSKLPGYSSLSKEDKAKVVAALPEMKPVKKEENGEEEVKKPKLDGREVYKKQNQLLYKYRDTLKPLNRNEYALIFEYNGQKVPVGDEVMLDRLADGMTFGALKPCKVCKKGQLVFRSGVGYFCLGNKDEWTRCEAVIDDPERKKFLIPNELKKKYEFLNEYKCKVQKRVFEANQPSTSVTSIVSQSIMKSTQSEASTSGPKVDKVLPLKSMLFYIGIKSKEEKTKIELDIRKLGGQVANKLTDSTTAVISNSNDVEKKYKYIKEAEELNIQVLPVTFITECQNGGNALQLIDSMNLVSWGSDPSNRMSANVVDSKSKSKSSRYKSNVPSKVKVVVKDGLVVDPDSELQDVAHVYRNGDEIFNAVLSLTDLQSGRNSYYKLQVLESESKRSKYWLFRSWGRVGTTIGGTKVETLSKDDAIQKFKFYFEEKTANPWEKRDDFVKVPGKMMMMQICYEDENSLNKVNDNVPSKLPKPVQDLISLIFNVTTMKNVMMEMELDLEKMPLGKLSKKQIQQAYQVLTKVQNELTKAGGGDVDVKSLIGYTNQFFSLIPHDFDIDTPPLLNSLELIKKKVDMLDALMDIEIAYSMLKDHTGENEQINRLDSHYLKLNAQVELLDKLSEEFKLLDLYVKNTHAETHRNYELEIIEVFKVNRSGEDKRYKPFKKLHNRKLLWHGSRLTNFAGIISQGLRVAPPEAPVTGYMFGKGVYFADMVSKSANYCLTSPANNTGLLLLCEVALGDCHELMHAQNIVKPPPGKHSVKGLGKTYPDPAQSVVMADGVEIPLGKGIPSPHTNTSLLYNEFIVYDVAQVKVRYLVQMKFKYAY
ncbi:hypothetical protein V9T40_012851 [Parthenolecanium corni]|uniref:Poly [ADP-ribose] polymerase n=1 Tax=Parthenolecanium corni TaxID=536013 RepID=A0AAN9TAC5_9HEMI